MLNSLLAKTHRTRGRISQAFGRQSSPQTTSVDLSRTPRMVSSPNLDDQPGCELMTPIPASEGPPSSGYTVADSVSNTWERAYDIASDKLSDEERKWVNEVRAQGTGRHSLAEIIENARGKIRDDRSGGIAPPLMGRLERLLKRVDKYAKVIDVAIQHSPEISALVWAGLRFILYVALDHLEALESLEKAANTVDISMADCEFYAKMYADFPGITLDSAETTCTFRQGLEEALPEFYAAVLVFFAKTRTYFLRSPFDKCRNCLEPFSENLKPLVHEIDNIRKKVKKFAEMATMKKVNAHYEMLRRTQTDTERAMIVNLIGSLPHAANAAFDSRLWDREPQCLSGTRVDLLNEIESWNGDCNGAPIFWLSGMAGTGKSTIARTVAQNLARKKQLGASFFFSRGQGDLGHAGKFFTTLAVQLASAFPEIKPGISKAIEADPGISNRGLQIQWKQLISEPLQELRKLETLAIVIDALEECSDEDDVDRIIGLLSSAGDFRGPRVRIFLTSRPETYIRSRFRCIPEAVHRDITLHDTPDHIVQNDISLFLNSEMDRVREIHGLPAAWPGEEVIRTLVGRAGTMFIYAATVCRFFRDRRFDPQGRLSRVLKTDTDFNDKLPTAGLDTMYAQVIKHSVTADYSEDVDELRTRFQRIVGPIVVLFDALSIRDLAMLIGADKGEIQTTLNPLRSVLHIPDDESDKVRLCHPSLREFLMSSTRCSNPDLYIDEQLKSREIVHNCLELMSSKLRKDMCSLRSPGPLGYKLTPAKIDHCIPLAVQYACRYWINHLRNAGDELRDGGRVHNFLLTHSFHWVEALGIIGELPEGLVALTTLESMLSYGSSGNREMRRFVYDMKRLLLSNISTLQIAPLQIYMSAHIFSPQDSAIRDRFADGTPHWLKRITDVEKVWTSLLQTLEGYSRSTNGVSFSPNGHLLASASSDKTVKLWDASTGVLRSTLEGHSGQVIGVAFSPDGQLLASASEDKTVRLWDTSTGVLLRVLRGHSRRVSAVLFSPNGQLLASTSRDRTARLWDASTGALRSTLKSHFSQILAVSFSPDGQLFASASSDATVGLWGTSTGVLRNTLKDHSGWVRAIAFSLDGRLLASASDDETVKLWDVSTGVLRSTLKGHTDPVCAVSFSPDGRLLASASLDKTVRLWDVSTGVLHNTLNGHSGRIYAISFSPDRHLLASASEDKTIRLWDASTGLLRSTLKGHSGQIYAVSFSPDGQLLASASEDMTVRLWEASTRVLSSALEGQPGQVYAISLSPDGQVLACAYEDRTVRLWDASTGVWSGTLKGHSSRICAISFSPDGQLLASVSEDETIRLWETSTKSLLRILEGHAGQVYAVSFSPDGQLLASTSTDGTARLWDASTGVLRSTLKGHSNRIHAISFSPDGRLFASASEDRRFKLWEVSTGVLRNTLDDQSGGVRAVSFSPDGQIFASASEDKTIRLWEASTGGLRCTLEGHSGPVYAVSFSPSGQLLASASGDGTIRLWDLPEVLSSTSERHSCSAATAPPPPAGELLECSSGVAQNPSESNRFSIRTINMPSVIRHLAFSEDNNLHTDIGAFKVQYSSTDPHRSTVTLFPRLTVTGAWVLYCGEQVLWLPPAYRRSCLAIRNNTLAIGCDSGRVVILETPCEDKELF